MSAGLTQRLGPEEIARLASPYLDHGVKQDAWEITEIDISEEGLTARVRMTSRYVSPTDPGGFHLTIFAALEFLAQLSNIYLHWLGGYETKCRETWMRDCAIKCRSSIRDPEGISVELKRGPVKRRGDTLASKAEFRVTDEAGGLFTGSLTGFLAG